MRRIFALVPVLLVILLGGFFLWGLNDERNPNEIPSPLVGRDLPAFELPPIEGFDTAGLTHEDLLQGDKPILLNFFASWCLPCRAEHKVLSQFAADEDVDLIGINYKDKSEDAIKWLDELGNPYRLIGADQGAIAIEFGLSGVPETYVISPNGKVVYLFRGPIVNDTAIRDMRNAVQKARE